MPASAADEEPEITPEMEATFKKIEDAATKGNRSAQYKLGLLYLGVNDFPKDFKKANEWFTIAMENGSINAIYNLATLAERGLGEDTDLLKALNLYVKASKRGVTKAAYKVWILSLKLNEVMEEPVLKPSDAFEYLRTAADGEVVEAEEEIGRQYLTGGEYVQKNVQKSLEYLHRAAGKGNVGSTRLLGKIFAGQIEGYQPLPDDAIKLLLPQAEKGDSVSQNLLGDIYASELLGKQDLTKAELWYTRAIEGGDDGARVNLGLLYADPKNKSIHDPQKAEDLLYEAARDNIPLAQFAMYELLTQPGRQTDVRAHRQAIIWLRTAAVLNLGRAQKALAQRFLTGDDLPRSPKEAYIWSTVALSNGQEDALQVQDAARQTMSPVQLAEADSEAQFRVRKISKDAAARSGGSS